MNLIITPEDFDLLRNNEMAWADILKYSADITSRFRVVAKRKTLDSPLTRIYWFGQDYTTVILARTFLENRGHEYEILWDNAKEWEKPPFGYAIVTDYEREGKRCLHCGIPLDQAIPPEDHFLEPFNYDRKR